MGLGVNVIVLHRFGLIWQEKIRFGILVLRDQRVTVAVDEVGHTGDMGSLFKVYCRGSFVFYSGFLD